MRVNDEGKDSKEMMSPKRDTPRANPEVSTSTSKGLSSWGCLSMGSLVTRSRRALNASSCLSSHMKGMSLRVSSLSGFAILEKLGIKGL